MTTPATRMTRAETAGSARISRPSKLRRANAFFASTATRPMPVIERASPTEKATIRTRPNARPVERDRGEQDDERRRAGEQAAGDTDGEQAPPRPAVIVRVIVMMVLVPVPMGVGVRQAHAEHGDADADDHQPGNEVDPRVEPVGDDPLR